MLSSLSEASRFAAHRVRASELRLECASDCRPVVRGRGYLLARLGNPCPEVAFPLEPTSRRRAPARLGKVGASSRANALVDGLQSRLEAAEQRAEEEKQRADAAEQRLRELEAELERARGDGSSK